MTHIRVHELASELSVSTQQVLVVLEGLGKKVRGPSTVIGVSDAAKVRSRLRTARASDSGTATSPPVGASVRTAPAGEQAATTAGPAARTAGPAVAVAQSLFLPPAVPPAASAYASTSAGFTDPFALPGVGPAFAAPASRQQGPATQRPITQQQAPERPSGQRSAAQLPPVQRVPPVEPVVAPAEDVAADWLRRGFDESAQELWCSSGIRPQDAALADRCRSTGIAPTDLPRKLSGRTVLQRLRDGESTTSVWARIQEAEQAPRRAGTKLTGRFQLS